jgi:hypothetical protein
MTDSFYHFSLSSGEPLKVYCRKLTCPSECCALGHDIYQDTCKHADRMGQWYESQLHQPVTNGDGADDPHDDASPDEVGFDEVNHAKGLMDGVDEGSIIACDVAMSTAPGAEHQGHEVWYMRFKNMITVDKTATIDSARTKMKPGDECVVGQFLEYLDEGRPEDRLYQLDPDCGCETHVMAIESVFAVDVEMHDRPDLVSRAGKELEEGETMVHQLSRATEKVMLRLMGQLGDSDDDDDD